jgi:starvation-inducible outer membrane lipoprotein
MLKKQSTLFILCMLLLLSSCVTVKEYQKNKLNDAEMALSARRVEKNEMNFQGYKEGASGANGGKTGGGCGCN